MLVSNGFVHHHYEQHHRPGMFLGRHMELDGRSLRYLAPPPQQPIMPHEWPTPIPTLDQGNVGRCVGNAATYHLAEVYGLVDFATIKLDDLVLGADPVEDEYFADRVYHYATIADGVSGEYPPDDTGSSGLGAARALSDQKLITSYSWAVSRQQIATLLQDGGCIWGTPWYQAWFEPDADGFVDSGDTWSDSDIAGGHETYIEALEAWDDADPHQCILRVHNSWGDKWGRIPEHPGCFRIRMSTYEYLASQIDVCQFHR